MSGWTKLFSNIIHSTIWREDNATRLVWVTMLAMANRNGVVESSIALRPAGLGRTVRVMALRTRQAIGCVAISRSSSMSGW